MPRIPARPKWLNWSAAGLCATGMWLGHVTTTYVTELKAPPLEKLNMALAHLQPMQPLPEGVQAVSPAAQRTCFKAWAALARVRHEADTSAARNDWNAPTYIIAAEMADVAIARKCPVPQAVSQPN